MPRPSELSEDLAPLTRRQALPVTHERFEADVEILTDAIAMVVGPKAVEQRPAPVTQEKPVQQFAAGTIATNPIDGLEYAWIPPGQFQMGAVADRFVSAETPRHRVEITREFWISQTPIPGAVYKRFADAMHLAASLGYTRRKGDHPAKVTWQEATRYCSWATTVRLTTHWRAATDCSSIA